MDPYRCGFGPCGIGHGAANRGWSWLGLIDSIALWLLLIAAVLVVVALIRRAGGGRAAFGASVRPVAAAPTGWAPTVPPYIAQAEATLADRFARGEISAEQYQNQLAVLRGYTSQQTAAPGTATVAPPSAAPYSAASDSGAPHSAAPGSTEQPPAGPAANP